MITEDLGIQSIHRVCLRGITNPVFTAMVIASVDDPPSKELIGRYDVIVHQVDAPADLENIARLAKHLETAGVLWVLHPSGANAAPDEMQVRSACLAAGLVVNKRCEYSVTHTATRFAPRAKVLRGTA